MRRPGLAISTIVVIVAVLASSAAAGARTDDTNGDRNAVQQHQVEVASELNALAASEQQLDKGILVLELNVQQQQRDLVTAQKAVVTAQHQMAAAQRGIDRESARLDHLHRAMVEYAVQAFVEPGGPGLGVVLDPGPVDEHLQRDGMAQVRSDQLGHLRDEMESARSDLQHEHDLATSAHDRATAQRAKVAHQITAVHTAQGQLTKLLTAVKARINVELAKAITLAEQNRQLSIQLAVQQLGLQARLYGLVPVTDATGAAGYGDGGVELAPLSGDPNSPQSQGTGVLQLCDVDGITINCLIAPQLGSMIKAAAQDGIGLAGGGWRSPAEQIALREAHCGTSLYAVYDEPASQCSPPTAPPGQSMHEIGFAIDFENSSSHGTPVWQWLSTHAATYGFYNLASEPWHWSVNGD